MTEAVSVVAGIVSLVLKINDVVGTVHQNKDDCIGINKRVQRIRYTLSLLEGKQELMKNQAVSMAIEALNEILASAVEFIIDSQEKMNILCVYLKARKISKHLSKVDQSISNAHMDVQGAILVYILSELTLTARPLRLDRLVASSLSKRTEYVSPSQSGVPNPSERMIEISQADQLPVLLRQTSSVARQVDEAVGTICQNIEECAALSERVNRLSEVLELAHMEKVKDPAMIGALEKLRDAFDHAHALVIGCQEPKTLNLRWLVLGQARPVGKVSKEICEVSDQMVVAVHSIISIILSYNQAPKVPQQQQQQYPTLVDTRSYTGPSSRPGP